MNSQVHEELYSVRPFDRRRVSVAVMETTGEPRGFLEYVEESEEHMHEADAYSHLPTTTNERVRKRPHNVLFRESCYFAHPFWANPSRDKLQCLRISLQLERFCVRENRRQCAMLSISHQEYGLFRIQREDFLGVVLSVQNDTSFVDALQVLTRMVTDNPLDCMVRVKKPPITMYMMRSRSADDLLSTSEAMSEWYRSEEEHSVDGSSSARAAIFHGQYNHESYDGSSSAYAARFEEVHRNSILSSDSSDSIENPTFETFFDDRETEDFLANLQEWKQAPTNELLDFIVEKYIIGGHPSSLHLNAERQDILRQFGLEYPVEIGTFESQKQVVDLNPELFNAMEAAALKQLSIATLPRYLSFVFSEASRNENKLIPDHCFDGFISCMLDFSPLWIQGKEIEGSPISLWHFDGANAIHGKKGPTSLVLANYTVVKAFASVPAAADVLVELLTNLEKRLTIDPNIVHFEEIKRFNEEFVAQYMIADMHIIGAKKRDFVLGRVVKRFGELTCIVDHDIAMADNMPEETAKYVRGHLKYSGYLIRPSGNGSEVYWMNQVSAEGLLSLQKTKKMMTDRGKNLLLNLIKAAQTKTT